MTAIDDKWREQSWLGAPVDAGAGSGEMAMPDGRGRARDFQNGSIYWTPEHGAHEVHGDIRVKWAQLGGHRSVLGYPISDERGSPDKRASTFQHGTITWTPSGGAVVAWNIDD